MTERKKVTMKDIALKANVTTQTVSRALSGSKNIHPKTKKRVLEIADELNYIKNSSASILRSGSSKIIAVFYDNLRNIFFSLMSDFLQINLKEYGYSIMTIPVYEDKIDSTYYNKALSQNVDGIITFIEPKKELLKKIEQSNLPFLIFGRRTESSIINSISFDDYKGGVLAAEELLKTNAKSFVMVTEKFTISCAKDRFLGFKETLEKNNLSLDVLDVGKKTIDDYFYERLKDDNLPDGIFCFNDMLAFVVLKFYEENNLGRPNVIGFDDLSKEILLPCRLKSIGANKYEAAKAASSLIVKMIENKENNSSVHIVFDVSLNQ